MSSYIVIKKEETASAHIFMCSDGIIRVLFKKNKEVNASDFKELFLVYNDLVQGNRHPFIYYPEDGSTTVTEDGRAYAKQEEFSFPKTCNAVVVTRLSHKLLANFYFKFNKPSHPFKVFNKMDDAEKWCLEQITLSKIKPRLHLEHI